MILIDIRRGVIGLIHRPERNLLEKQFAAAALQASGAKGESLAWACDEDSVVVEVSTPRCQATASCPAGEDPRPTFTRLAALVWMGG